MKIAYIGIDLLFPALVALRGAGCEIVKIFSCKTDNITEFNTAVLGFAEQNKIPYTLEKITLSDINELKRQGCDAIICAGYYYRIPVCEDMPTVNIHPSLLPDLRGAWPMPLTILKGFNESGVTIHKVVEKLDAGDILLQESFPVAADETHSSLMGKIHALLKGMMENLAKNFDTLYLNARQQCDAEYCPAPTESDYTITHDMSRRKADVILRAFFGYECIYIADDGKKYEMISAVVASNKKSGYQYFPLKDGFIEVQKVKELPS